MKATSQACDPPPMSKSQEAGCPSKQCNTQEETGTLHTWGVYFINMKTITIYKIILVFHIVFADHAVTSKQFKMSFYVSLIAHLVMILVNDQLDAQFFSMRLFQFSTCFEQPRAHHQENQLYQYHLWYMSLCVGNRCVCRSDLQTKRLPTHSDIRGFFSGGTQGYAYP